MDAEAESESKSGFEDAFYLRMIALIENLSELTKCYFQGTSSEHLLRLLHKAYNIIVQASKMLITGAHYPSQRFQTLISRTCKKLSPSVYAFILPKSSRVTGIEESKAKIKREQILVPKLIFEIERFDHFVIRLSSVFKIEMTRWLKTSTTRDFRLHKDQLDENELAEANEKKQKKIKKEKSQKKKSQKKPKEEESEENQDSQVVEEELQEKKTSKKRKSKSQGKKGKASQKNHKKKN